MVVMLTGQWLLSKRMAALLLSQAFGLELSPGTISAMEQRMAEALAAPVAEAHEHVKGAPVVHADETSWRESKSRAWLWVATTALVAVFMIHRRRNAKAAQVLLGDSIGEMNAYYPMADLVFVGASLVDHGGHNIMEPMALGRPVVMGPSTYGIAFAAEPAAQAGALESLPDAAALEARIASLLADPSGLAAMATAAQGFSAHQTGAADRTMAGLLAVLQERSS